MEYTLLNHIHHKTNKICNYLNNSNITIKKLIPCDENSNLGSEHNKFNEIYAKRLYVDNNSIHFSNSVSLKCDKNCNLVTVDHNGNEYIIPTLKHIEEMEINHMNYLKEDLENKKKTLLNYFSTLDLVETEIYQKDFLTGSYVIKKPGIYKLKENIEFNPNSLSFLNSEHKDAIELRNQNNLQIPVSPWYTGDVLPSQYSIYEPKAFGLGFFAAIIIQEGDVIIDLNGFEIKQSKEHALQQRFFSVFELANQPFIPTQGPHSFGNELIPANKCFIKNGIIGLSSHHGIHGNNNSDILLKDIVFQNFEVAACSLNKVHGLYCCNVKVKKNRHDIPVLGIWSSARFLRPYMNHLLKNNWDGTIANKNISTVYSELKDAMEKTFNTVLNNNDDWENTEEYKLFGNSSGLIDGNSYGFLTNTGGVAVLGFPSSRLTSSKDIYFNNVVVQNVFSKINEIPALKSSDGKQMKDQIGSVFQTQNKDQNGTFLTINHDDNSYNGNVVSNAQLIVTKAILEGYNFGSLSVVRNSITKEVIEWADGTRIWDFTFLCNGDSMFHVNKGSVIFKMDATENIYLNNCICENIKNNGLIGSTLCNDDNPDYKNKIGKSHPNATYNGYGGSNTRGFSFSTSKNVFIENCSCKNISSSYGFSYGFDIHQYSKDIMLKNCEAIGIYAGIEADIDEYNNNPTSLPISVGFHIEKNTESVKIENSYVLEQTSIYKTYNCLKENY